MRWQSSRVWDRIARASITSAPTNEHLKSDASKKRPGRRGKKTVAVDADVLIDTNVLSYLLLDTEEAPGYRALIQDCEPAIALISVAELNVLASAAGWGEQKTRDMDRFLDEFIQLHGTTEIALLAATLKARAGKVGRQLTWPDVWIAATALTHGVPLVTHDRDFFGIPGLELWTLLDGWHVSEAIAA
jgi:predicted nucleic acid-binding protein